MEPFDRFYTFVFLGFCSFTFTGQMFVSLLRDSETAQAVGGMWVTFSVLFSGVLIRPDVIPNFWVFAYWIFPGHYLFEALFTTQFHDDTTIITASPGSAFYDALGCAESPDTICEGTISVWFETNFQDFSRDNVYYCGIYFVALIIGSRLAAFWALTSLNYRST